MSSQLQLTATTCRCLKLCWAQWTQPEPGRTQANGGQLDSKEYNTETVFLLDLAHRSSCNTRSGLQRWALTDAQPSLQLTSLQLHIFSVPAWTCQVLFPVSRFCQLRGPSELELMTFLYFQLLEQKYFSAMHTSVHVFTDLYTRKYECRYVDIYLHIHKWLCTRRFRNHVRGVLYTFAKCQRACG